MILRLFAIVLVLLAVATAARYAAAKDAVRCVETKAAITVYAGQRPVLRYNKTTVEPPAGIEPVYRRSGYIHPVWSPAGRIVTGDFAPDHPHQHAVFFAYVNTRFEGQAIDFWNQVKKTGDILHRRVIAVDNGVNFAQFQVEIAHDALLKLPEGQRNSDEETGDDGRAGSTRRVTALIETWTVRVAAAGDGFFLFDIDSVQRCATESPLVILEYHYGGLGVRGANEWYRSGAAKAVENWQQRNLAGPDRDREDPPGPEVTGHDFLTSLGKRRHDGNHTPARWISIFGAFAGESKDKGGAAIAGIAVLSHPANFRDPQPVRLHPDKPYFCYAPMVKGEYQITPAAPLHSRYRFIVYDGPPDAQALEQQFGDYTR